VIARLQSCVTDSHKHQEQRDTTHLLQPHWLSNDQVEQLAANTPTTPQDAIASLLQRLVRLPVIAPTYSSGISCLLSLRQTAAW
jgi:hypothetical protein